MEYARFSAGNEYSCDVARYSEHTMKVEISCITSITNAEARPDIAS